MESQLDALRRELLEKTEKLEHAQAEIETSEKERRHQLAENTRRTAQLHDENSALKVGPKSNIGLTINSLYIHC